MKNINLRGVILIPSLAGEESQQMRNEKLNLLRRALRPKFLNRIDEIIVFHSFSFEEVNRRLTEQKMSPTLTEKAKEHLAEVGFDPACGARSLKRVIQKQITQPLANEILKGKFKAKGKIKIDVKDDMIVFI